jgi:hypothetical protein
MNKLSVIFLLLLLPGLVLGDGETIDSQFANPTTLTDKQMSDAKTFTHQGVKDRVVQEGCAKLNNCTSDDSGVKLEQLIGKAYALMGVVTGSGMIPQLTAKAAPATPNAQNVQPQVAGQAGGEAAGKAGEAAKDAGKETKPDYCMMVAMAYEALGGMIQQALQKKAENATTSTADTQLQSLISLKETHKARKTTATLQGTIYGGVTTCYAAMAFTGEIALDWKYWVKVGGAATLTALYVKKALKHKNAANDVQAVIDSLPKAGDCNPWTGTSCFCSEVTSKTAYPTEYQEVCVLNKGDFTTPTTALGCGKVVDNKVQYDEQCTCKQTNTCLKTNFSTFAPKVANVSSLMNDANKALTLVNSGEFSEGKLAAYTTGAAALAAKMKGKLDQSTIPKPVLNAEQKKVADALSDYMPASMANLAAGSDTGYTGGISEASMSSSAISKLPASVKAKLADAIKVNYQQGSGPSSAGSSEPEFTMPSFGGQAAAETSGTEVVSFAEQAVSKADVSNTPETPIFDIISNRYRRSGWEKLNRLEK